MVGQWSAVDLAMTSYKKVRSEEVSSLQLKSLRTVLRMFLVVLVPETAAAVSSSLGLVVILSGATVDFSITCE